MKQINWNDKKWIWYTLYCILLAGAVLYYRFPSDTLKDYFHTKVHELNPLLNVSFEKLALSFPFGVKLKQAEFSLKENPGKAHFKTEVITLRPSLWSFFRKSPEYHFRCSAYGGNLKGYALSENRDSGLFYHASIILEDVDVDENFPFSIMIGDRLEGTLNGNISYGGDRISPANGAGDAALTLSKGRIRLLKPVLELEAVEFDELLINFTLKEQKLNVTNIELKGKDMHGVASGTISFERDLSESRLDLKGTIEPYAELFINSPTARDIITFFKQGSKDGKLSFTINGSIEHPRINFI